MERHCHISRRQCLRTLAALGVAGGARPLLRDTWAQSAGQPRRRGEGLADLESVVAVADGRGPVANTEAVLEAVGGMGRFVKKGDLVAVKPNIAWNRSVAQGANSAETSSGVLAIAKSTPSKYGVISSRNSS